MNTADSLKQLWLGQLPLREAFWRWLITYDLILHLVATMCIRIAIIASSSIVRTVDFGSFGPVGVSETVDRFFHLATVC